MSSPPSPTTTTAPSVPVWDLGVRLFHWSLALAVAAALGLGFLGPKRLLDWHVLAGYAAAALVLFRLVWGVVGTTFARFSSFPPSLSAVRAHLAGKQAAAYGHNPLGALMVYALLAIVLALVVSGIVTLGGALRQGPLSALVAYADGRTAGEVHEWLAWAIAGLVALHIGGVLFESRRERENLARSMLTGRKRPRRDATPDISARPAAALAALALAGIAIAGAWTWASRLPNRFIPAAPLPEWAAECGDCHTAHHPSLLPAARWSAIMAGLDDHFGEDASLDAPTAGRIGAWLVANAAERHDTMASNAFRLADAAEPLRITATARWRRIHRDIPAETFRRSGIGAAANCAACHGDAATGLFAPQQISIPDPRKEQP